MKLGKQVIYNGLGALLCVLLLTPTTVHAQAGAELFTQAENEIYGFVTLIVRILLGVCVIALIFSLGGIALSVARKDNHNLPGWIMGVIATLIVGGILVFIGNNPRIFG